MNERRDPLAGLVARARAGDDAAFATLVARTHAETWTLAMRLLGDADDAADVVQEAYIRAHRGLAGFRADARFTTWLHRITVNCASTHLGRRRRHRHESLADDHPVPEGRRDADPQARLDDDVLCDELAEHISALPPRLRAVLVLRDVYDLPHDVIAAELGISTTASKVRLHRARTRLRDALTADADIGHYRVRARRDVTDEGSDGTHARRDVTDEGSGGSEVA